MSDWLEKFRKGQKKLDYSLWYLGNISNVLYQSGNEKLSHRIRKVYDNLLEASNELDECIKQHIYEEYKLSQEASANILKTALAGGQLEKENPSD